MARRGRSILLLGGASMVAACSAVLDIEDARLDPSLAADGGGVADSEQEAGVPIGADGGGGSAGNGGDGGDGGGGNAAGNGGNGGADADVDGGQAAPEGGVEAGTGDAGQASLCQRYCDRILANCTGDFEIYPSRAVCESMCGTFPVGNEGDQADNTLHCRLENARLAKTTGEPGVHCPAAGPGGDGICGENCEGYCSGILDICDEFVSRTACREACAMVPDMGGFDDSIQGGNSIQCRLYHLGAATQANVPHCSHAAGASPCAE